MELGKGIYQKLINSKLFGSRVYPFIAGERASNPCAVYSLLNTDRAHTLTKDCGYTYERYQISIFANTPKEAADLSKKVRKIFQDFKGPLGDQEVQGVLIQTEMLTQNTYGTAVYGTEPDYQAVLEFEFQYQEK